MMVQILRRIGQSQKSGIRLYGVLDTTKLARETGPGIASVKKKKLSRGIVLRTVIVIDRCNSRLGRQCKVADRDGTVNAVPGLQAHSVSAGRNINGIEGF